MHNQLKQIIFTFLIFSFALLNSNYAFAQSDPVVMLEDIANNMISGLKSNQATLKSKPQIVYGLAQKYIVPHADLDEMSKRVLPPQIWNNASTSQRQQFKKEFTTTLIRTYSSALAAYQDQTIRFYPIRGGYQGQNSVEIKSEILSDGQSISVVYRLNNVNGNWLVYDMSVEGVSMLNSFRSQFAGLLSSGSMEELLQRMSKHNNG